MTSQCCLCHSNNRKINMNLLLYREIINPYILCPSLPYPLSCRHTHFPKRSSPSAGLLKGRVAKPTLTQDAAFGRQKDFNMLAFVQEAKAWTKLLQRFVLLHLFYNIKFHNLSWEMSKLRDQTKCLSEHSRTLHRVILTSQLFGFQNSSEASALLNTLVNSFMV